MQPQPGSALAIQAAEKRHNRKGAGQLAGSTQASHSISLQAHRGIRHTRSITAKSPALYSARPRMTMPASTAASSAANPPKKHRQTRIPEHLKAVKKGTSSSSSSASSSSSSSLKSSLARALRASSPRKSESASSAAAAPALELQAHRSQNNGHALTPTASMDDVINAQMSTYVLALLFHASHFSLPSCSPSYPRILSPSCSLLPALGRLYPDHALVFLQVFRSDRMHADTVLYSCVNAFPSNRFSPGYPVQHQQQFGMSATSARPPPMTSPHALQQSPVRPLMATQASIHSINGTPSPSSARLPYSLTNERANELAASVERSSSQQHGFPGIPMQQQQPRQSISSRPSTSTSTMAQDSTLLARSCSSASSMAYSQPDFAFSVAAPSSSSQSLSSMSSAFTQPSVMDSSSSYQQMAIWPPPSFSNTNQIGTIPYVQSPSPLKTSESNASLSSLPNQIPLEMRQKVPTRTKRSSTTLSAMSGSSTSSSSQARLSSSSASVFGKQTSPKSPATPFSASLILSVSSDGKARLTTPQKVQKTNEMLWGSNNSTPKPTAA